MSANEHSEQQIACACEPTEEQWNIRIETSPRWVRIYYAGQLIADSKRALLVKESQHLPLYYIPVADVREDLLELTPFQKRDDHKGVASFWNIRVGDRISHNAAWSYAAPKEAASELQGHIAFFWEKVDSWYEEEEQLIKHARDPYKRVDVLPTSRHIKVELDGVLLAESNRAVVVYETYHTPRYYFPLEDIRTELLEPSDKLTECPYKGKAAYLDVLVKGTRHANIVWTYPDPLTAVEAIRGLYSFYNEKVDAIYVDDAAWELEEGEKLPSQFIRL